MPPKDTDDKMYRKILWARCQKMTGKDANASHQDQTGDGGLSEIRGPTGDGLSEGAFCEKSLPLVP